MTPNERMVMNEQGRMWNEVVLNYFNYYPSNSLEWLTKITKSSVRISGSWNEIRIPHLQNAKQNFNHYTATFCKGRQCMHGTCR